MSLCDYKIWREPFCSESVEHEARHVTEQNLECVRERERMKEYVKDREIECVYVIERV